MPPVLGDVTETPPALGAVTDMPPALGLVGIAGFALKNMAGASKRGTKDRAPTTEYSEMVI